MGEQKEEIPLVDFDVFTDESQRDRVAQEIVNAFEKIGFVYLKYEHLANEAHAVFEMAKKFFHKPLEEKLLVKAGSNPRDLCGYHPTQTHGTLNNDLDADGNLKKLAKNEIKFDSKEMFQIFARDVFQFSQQMAGNPRIQGNASQVCRGMQESQSRIDEKHRVGFEQIQSRRRTPNSRKLF